MEINDTICAVSTPPGEGGIGILRLSGPLAHFILRKIFKTSKGGGTFESHRLYLGSIIDPDNLAIVDQAYAVFMSGPRTYTREDVGEVFSHGGFAVQRKILSLMIAAGARLAEPGEFTRRAFLSGRIDLAQAESVLDVIESETDEELRYAVGNLRGALSGRIGMVKEKLTNALVETEALIDFPEEDVDVDEEGIGTYMEEAREALKSLVDSYHEGNAVRHGMEVLIAGRTNVGKSSLLNALIARQRAIVTPIPGTTRDLIEDMIHIKGIKVRLVDTAGIGLARDEVEEEGMERVRRRIPEADLVLWVLDGSRPYSPEDEEVYRTIGRRPSLAVVNKLDLPPVLDQEILREKGVDPIYISALQEQGTEEVKQAVYTRLMGSSRRGNNVLVTNIRHRTGLARALEAVDRAIGSHKGESPKEFTAFDLREAINLLGEITGEAWTDDILHEIFSRFCIGK
ncbi:MAG TPA: tRNA uridine-5-carboxymethylaminomethyl(34) synthesis GTPase MnmE [Syntrophorhabdaceae bacterium]|jgi:tRNA modification GTPase